MLLISTVSEGGCLTEYIVDMDVASVVGRVSR
jgi:hypothetical protein